MANNNKSNNLPAVGTKITLRPFTITNSNTGLKVSEMRTPNEKVAVFEDGLEAVVGAPVGSGEFWVEANGLQARCHKNKIAGSEEAAAYVSSRGQAKPAEQAPAQVKVVAGATLVLDPMPTDAFDALVTSLSNIQKVKDFLVQAEQVRIDAVKAAQAKRKQVEALSKQMGVLDAEIEALAGSPMPE